MIKSTGGSTLQIADISVSGSQAGDFSQDGKCNGASVPPGQSCTFNASFSPSDSGDSQGNYAATITIASNARSGSQSVQLSAGPRTITVTQPPAAQNTGDFVQIPVTNNGPGSLPSLTSSITSSFKGFHLDPEYVTCNSPIPSGGNCSIGVDFSASGPPDQGTGNWTATVHITGAFSPGSASATVTEPSTTYSVPNSVSLDESDSWHVDVQISNTGSSYLAGFAITAPTAPFSKGQTYEGHTSCDSYLSSGLLPANTTCYYPVDYDPHVATSTKQLEVDGWSAPDKKIVNLTGQGY